MRRRCSPALILGLFVLSLCAIAPAFAVASSQEVLRDCVDGKIDGTYSQKDFREALQNLSSDVDQYTDCRGVIEAARLNAASGSSASGGSAASGSLALPSFGPDPLASATPAQRVAVAAAQQTAPPSLTIGGKVVEPAALGARRPVASSLASLPAPLLATIVLAMLAGGGALGASLIPRVRKYLDL